MYVKLNMFDKRIVGLRCLSFTSVQCEAITFEIRLYENKSTKQRPTYGSSNPAKGGGIILIPKKTSKFSYDENDKLSFTLNFKLRICMLN